MTLESLKPWRFFFVILAINVALWTLSFHMTSPVEDTFEVAPVVLKERQNTFHPFLMKVARWSWELRDTPAPMPGPDAGNCLPVAIELQKRIVATGRMAILLVTDPDPTDEIKHALVLFDHDKDGSFDHVIDNGFSTGHFPRESAGLYTGEFGVYLGRLQKNRNGTYRIATAI